MNNLKLLALTPLMVVSFASNIHADDVIETLQEAIKSYENAEYSIAVEDINYALQLIQQKKGQGLESYLPEALPGWNAEKAKSKSAGAAMMGGGIITSRQYNKGTSKVGIEIITDSPMMQGMMGIFTNPMFATADGGKLERINREKAIVRYDEQKEKGEITLAVGKRFFIKIQGQKVSIDDLKAYAKAIDFKKLKRLP